MWLMTRRSTYSRYLSYSESPMKDVHVGSLDSLIELGHCLFSDFDREKQVKLDLLLANYLDMHVEPYLVPSNSASEIRQEHPLNLSILLSGGKEINEDCLSSGE